ncbi:hypothetical protein HID58_006381, partial [Brassica napus]
PLRALNKTHYGDLPARTKQAYEELCNCQNTVLQDPKWSIRGSRSRRFHELRNSILQREPPQPENGKDI